MLKLDRVTQIFRFNTALQDVSLELPERGVVALVGPNGAGKSTLLDILCGNLRPSQGAIELLSDNSSTSRKRLMQIFSRLHQRLVIPAEMMVKDYFCLANSSNDHFFNSVAFSADWCTERSFGNDSQEWLPGVLEAIEIDNRLDEKIGFFSYGQQRAIALCAQLLVPGRKGVLLDEPFVGIADQAKPVVQDAISCYAESRLVVLAEHDIDRVRKFADQMVVLVGGEVAEVFQSEAVRTADIFNYFVSSSE